MYARIDAQLHIIPTRKTQPILLHKYCNRGQNFDWLYKICNLRFQLYHSEELTLKYQ